MKSDLHPEYNTVVFHDVSSDYKLLTRSTMTSEETIQWEDGNTYPLIKVEISSASHPFYTGKRQQIAERGGRIEQFRRRYGSDAAAPAPTAETEEPATATDDTADAQADS
mgnify:CR=1 FL=1